MKTKILILSALALIFLAQAVSASLLISGSIDINDNVELDNVYHIQADEDAEADSEYYTEFFDVNNELIKTFYFDVFPEITPEQKRYFIFSADVIGMKRIDILHNGYAIRSFTTSDNSPIIQLITYPSGIANGEQEISWISGDEDNELLHDLYYRCNSFEWRLVGYGIKESNYNIDFSGLPGGENCQIKIIANDGYNEAESISGFFSVEDKAPVASMLQADGSVISKNIQFIIEGYAYDLEDEFIENIEWSSDVDGFLGNDRFIYSKDLSLGEHRITLTAFDSSGLISQDSKRVTITNEIIPDARIENFMIGSEIPIKGNSTTITARIRSIIDDSIAIISFYDGDVLIKEQEIYLSANEIVDVNAEFIPREVGDHNIKVLISSIGMDSNLDNNEMQITKRVFPKNPADANGDDRVNIRDLLFVRTKMNANVILENNWQADTNRDNRVNILDLIYVRGKLNTLLGILSLIYNFEK